MYYYMTIFMVKDKRRHFVYETYNNMYTRNVVALTLGVDIDNAYLYV